MNRTATIGHRPTGVVGGSRVDWLPPADIVETDETFEISLEICGVPREDIVVDLEANRLTVSGGRDTDADDRTCHYRERPRGRFLRSFSFRAPVDDAGIEARLADGVLTLSIPKMRPKRIGLT